MLSRHPWHTFQLDMARCLWAILRRHSVLGRELSSRAGRGRRVPSLDEVPVRIRVNWSADLRGQHSRSDRGSAGRQPDSGSLDRHAGLAARHPGAHGLKRAVLLGAYALSVRRNHRGLLTLGSGGRRDPADHNVDPIPGQLDCLRPADRDLRRVLRPLYQRRSQLISRDHPLMQDGAIEVDVNGHVEATTELST